MELRKLKADMTFTNYIPLPRSILEMNLPTTAILIYGLLLDRSTLSRRHGYTDGAGWIYVVYPIHTLAERLRLSGTAIKENLKKLEAAGLLRRVRRCRSQASQLFLLVPEDALLDSLTDGFQAGDSRKCGPPRAGKAAPNNKREQPDNNNLYQHEEAESL